MLPEVVTSVVGGNSGGGMRRLVSDKLESEAEEIEVVELLVCTPVGIAMSIARYPAIARLSAAMAAGTKEG